MLCPLPCLPAVPGVRGHLEPALVAGVATHHLQRRPTRRQRRRHDADARAGLRAWLELRPCAHRIRARRRSGSRCAPLSIVHFPFEFSSPFGRRSCLLAASHRQLSGGCGGAPVARVPALPLPLPEVRVPEVAPLRDETKKVENKRKP